MATKQKELWMRAGVTLLVTDEEAAKILDHEASEAVLAATVREIIEEGRFKWDGSSYIPACCIADFNEKYDTDFDDDGGPEWSF